MKIALLSAAVNGDNAGDAIIEDAIRRIVSAEHYDRFPLVQALSDTDLAGINACDHAIVCGTNLYQHVFACQLTPDVIRKIKVPLTLLGIGTSAPIGKIPTMNPAGVEAVRMLHDRCKVSSVRDGASLRFLSSIGVKNAVLTGCPVLFHALKCPQFDNSGSGCTLAPRARLLHTANPKVGTQLEAVQLAMLHAMARHFHPAIVLQSPYDLPLAEELKRDHDCPIVYDPAWQVQPFVDMVRRQQFAMGFRLHWGMLSLSYGKHAFIVAHDSRVSEFCELVGLPLIRLEELKEENLLRQIEQRDLPWSNVTDNWRRLSHPMRQFLSDQGLPCAITSSM